MSGKPENEEIAEAAEEQVADSAQAADSSDSIGAVAAEGDLPLDSERAGDSDAVDSSADQEELEDEDVDDLLDDGDDEEFEDVDPIEEIGEDEEEDLEKRWYILKIQVNRESSICAALERRVKVSGLERFFGDILVPTEDVREFTKSGKQRTVKRKLYPGYIVVNMVLNEETWFLVRETPGIGDFTGSAGKPAPLSQVEVDRIVRASRPVEDGEEPAVKIGIKFKVGDRIRVKEGNFLNFEGDVETIDQSNGRIVVLINIFNRPTPVELEHWQVETI
jgi:transcriptional antiterminator NusG